MGRDQRRQGVTLKPCLSCGELSQQSRCPEHQPKPKATTKLRPKGHVHTNPTRWKRLSDKARKLQPWCLDCGTHDDLTGDHIIPVHEDPSLAYEVLNIAVRCRSCNGRRGANVTEEERHAVRWAIAARKARNTRFHPPRSTSTTQEGSQAPRGEAPPATFPAQGAKAQGAVHTEWARCQ
jgi:5-methylcytosine-specific restriction endonuclease McrA